MFSIILNAGVYKWVDDNGKVNYGNWPPLSSILQPK